MDNKPQSASETERPVESQLGEDRTPQGRRAFVEPEITPPVDVLEATTFFNTATSGVP